MSYDGSNPGSTRTSAKRSLATDDVMFGHFLVHGVILGLYALSLLAFWALGFQPIFGTGCGLPLLGGMMIFSLLAYGPSKNALEKGSERGVRLYKIVGSPLLVIVSLVTLVATWIIAFDIAYHVSVLA